MKKLVVFLFLFALIPVSSVHGLMIKIDWETLWQESEVAVLGTVFNIENVQGSRFIYRIVTIQVEDYFIQQGNETAIKIRIEGGEVGEMGVWVEDQPDFHIGERVFVFLRTPENAEGDYEFLVYGGIQGKFNINGPVARSITGESFTIPDPLDTMRETTPNPEEEVSNTTEIDTYIMITAVISAMGALVLNWALKRNNN